MHATMSSKLRLAPISVALLLVVGAQTGNSQDKVQAAQNSPPKRHSRIPDASYMEGNKVEKIYQALRKQMQAGFALSGDPTAINYQKWQRYNRVAFRSAGHGRRFVSTYANETAKAYGKYERAGTLPVGSIIAKDSIIITDDGRAVPGVLAIMEKMPDGFKYVSGNWKYSEIRSDGKILGTTNGKDSEQVAFCIACHLMAEAHDHLRFMPERFRR